MHLSQRDLERRLEGLEAARNAGILVSPCFVERGSKGYVVFDGGKKSTRLFSLAADAARYLMIRSGIH